MINHQAPRPHWSTFLRGKRKQRGTMNKIEEKYAQHLDGLKMLGQVEWWAFESVSLRLADGARYTPDFMVMTSSGFLEFHEVKGFWAEAAKVRIKVAADIYPARFIAVKAIAKKHGGGWGVEEF